MSADEDRRGGFRRVDDVDFRDLIAGLGESIAEAQLELERGFVRSVRELAGETTEVVPRVTRTVREDEHGEETVTYASETETRSLLELGVTPPRYQFSEATVDVEFDVSFAFDDGTVERDTGARGRTRLRADTYEVTHRRRYHEDASATARVSARLVPVPSPVSLGEPPAVEEREVVASDGASGGRDDRRTETEATPEDAGEATDDIEE